MLLQLFFYGHIGISLVPMPISRGLVPSQTSWLIFGALLRYLTFQKCSNLAPWRAFDMFEKLITRQKRCQGGPWPLKISGPLAASLRIFFWRSPWLLGTYQWRIGEWRMQNVRNERVNKLWIQFSSIFFLKCIKNAVSFCSVVSNTSLIVLTITPI